MPGRTLLPVPGYDHKIEFGVLVHFAYPVEDSGKKDDQHTISPCSDNTLPSRQAMRIESLRAGSLGWVS